VVEIVEQGTISFLATPREGVLEPAGPSELEHLFVVLAPQGKRLLRRLRVARRRLPGRARGQRCYAHVDRIALAPWRLTEDLRELRGPASRPARVLGVGRYALALHADHVHLAWALARACGRGPLASAVGIVPGESWVLCVFCRSLPPGRRPPTSEPLVAATPERLDVIGVEVALVAGSKPRDTQLGISAADRDHVGDALLGALLRKGPRPRIASFARGVPPAPGNRSARGVARGRAQRNDRR
jgi:hypothetical protein